jgi:hypothetical protein
VLCCPALGRPPPRAIPTAPPPPDMGHPHGEVGPHSGPASGARCGGANMCRLHRRGCTAEGDCRRRHPGGEGLQPGAGAPVPRGAGTCQRHEGLLAHVQARSQLAAHRSRLRRRSLQSQAAGARQGEADRLQREEGSEGRAASEDGHGQLKQAYPSGDSRRGESPAGSGTGLSLAGWRPDLCRRSSGSGVLLLALPLQLTRRCSWRPGGRRAGAWCLCASLAALPLPLPHPAAPDVVPPVFMGPSSLRTPHHVIPNAEGSSA